MLFFVNKDILISLHLYLCSAVFVCKILIEYMLAEIIKNPFLFTLRVANIPQG